MIEYGEAVLWAEPIPACPVHGQMHYHMAKDWWECAGFDGEGCDHRVTAEEVFRDAKPIGTGEITFKSDQPPGIWQL